MNLLLTTIFLPVISALFILAFGVKKPNASKILAVSVSLISAICAGIVFFARPEPVALPWIGNVIEFTLKIDGLNSFVLLFVGIFSFLTALYVFGFNPEDRKFRTNYFYFNLLMTQGFASGAVAADNMVAMLFFWEGLLIFLYSFVALSGDSAKTKRTAMKTFLINASTDLCLLAGITITGYIAGTMNMSEISTTKLTLDYGWSIFAYTLLMIGAISKAGAFPFHTWIPDASTDSNASFMAYMPSAIDKLLGIYFLARASIYLFDLNMSMQLVLMVIGAITILFSMFMAVIQTDYRRMLAYSTIGQTGYMILGIGTLHPLAIAGALFHMINHATYKSCLFMTSGSIERQTGQTDMRGLGGLFSAMPITAICLIISGAAISGIAPLNGFFSKELIFKGTVFGGFNIFFFLIAELGSLLTLTVIIKFIHSVFFGKKQDLPDNVSEAPVSMLIPMVCLAAASIMFGFGGKIPTDNFILPALGTLGINEALHISGFHVDRFFAASLIVVMLAVVNHMVGIAFSKFGPAGAGDYIKNAPVFKQIFNAADAKCFDVYEIFMDKILPPFACFLSKIDRLFDNIIDKWPSAAANFFGKCVSFYHCGDYRFYITLTAVGTIIFILMAAKGGFN